MNCNEGVRVVDDMHKLNDVETSVDKDLQLIERLPLCVTYVVLDIEIHVGGPPCKTLEIRGVLGNEVMKGIEL